MMASTISCTEERIAHLHNNDILPNDDQVRCLALLNKYFFKTTNCLFHFY